MIVVIILLSAIFGLLLYLVFAPFYIEVNSNTGLFRVRLHHAASFSLIMEDRLYLETRIFGMKKISAVVLYNNQHKKTQPINTKIQPKQPSVRRISAPKLLAVLKSFKLNKCRIAIDSGNAEWNGMLYPIAYCLAWYSKKSIDINFVGNNEIVLEIQNSIARMSWAFISSKI